MHSGLARDAKDWLSANRAERGILKISFMTEFCRRYRKPAAMKKTARMQDHISETILFLT